jgi:hypothetical protein
VVTLPLHADEEEEVFEAEVYPGDMEEVWSQGQLIGNIDTKEAIHYRMLSLFVPEPYCLLA